jgi:hypothetical protein
MYLFAHLARVTASAGPISKGDAIGIMGCSGAAGHRHVHVSVTAVPAHKDRDTVLATPGWTGQIPVRFRLAAAGADNLLREEWSDRLVGADVREQAVGFRTQHVR